VGLFVKREAQLDAAGKPTGKELWTTFDGGQHVAGKVNDQGAKGTLRLYDPATNEISSATKGPGGIVTQDGKTRWLAGWTDVDALVDPARQDAPKP
jgi:hypothetical protein